MLERARARQPRGGQSPDLDLDCRCCLCCFALLARIGASHVVPQAAFVAMCAFICDSAEGYLAASQEHGAEIRGDITNYTDIVPLVQLSEGVVERSDR